jgi:hypothetical protein
VRRDFVSVFLRSAVPRQLPLVRLMARGRTASTGWSTLWFLWRRLQVGGDVGGWFRENSIVHHYLSARLLAFVINTIHGCFTNHDSATTPLHFTHKKLNLKMSDPLVQGLYSFTKIQSHDRSHGCNRYIHVTQIHPCDRSRVTDMLTCTTVTVDVPCRIR